MTTTLVPDTRTDRHAIARALVEVEYAEHEAALWRELADFLAEPLVLHNLLATAQTPGPVIRRELRGSTSNPHRDGVGTGASISHRGFVPAVPFHHRDTALDTLGARVQASIEAEPEPEHVLADVAPRRGGKYRRTDRPGWWQRLRDAWADETGGPA